MTKVEIIFVIAACCAPIVALLFILPKYKKKEKQAEKENAEVTVEPFKMDKVDEQAKDTKEESVTKSDDFSNYISSRPKDLKKRNKMPEWLTDTNFTLPKREIKKEPDTIAEQFDELTPEMKAMFIAGVFDRRDY